MSNRSFTFAKFLHFDLRVIVVRIHCKVWMWWGWPKFITGQYKEHIGGHLLEHFVQPAVLKRNSNLQQIDDDSREINIAHDHNIKLTEQFQLSQINGGLAIGCRCFLQMPYRPNYREQNCTAAQQIDENENVSPCPVLFVALFALSDYYLCNIG